MSALKISNVEAKYRRIAVLRIFKDMPNEIVKVEVLDDCTII